MDVSYYLILYSLLGIILCFVCFCRTMLGVFVSHCFTCEQKIFLGSGKSVLLFDFPNRNPLSAGFVRQCLRGDMSRRPHPEEAAQDRLFEECELDWHALRTKAAPAPFRPAEAQSLSEQAESLSKGRSRRLDATKFMSPDPFEGF